MGDELERRLRRAEAAGAGSGEAEKYVTSLRLSDGTRLLDVVAPRLVYQRSRDVSREQAILARLVRAVRLR